MIHRCQGRPIGQCFHSRRLRSGDLPDQSQLVTLIDVDRQAGCAGFKGKQAAPCLLVAFDKTRIHPLAPVDSFKQLGEEPVSDGSRSPPRRTAKKGTRAAKPARAAAEPD